MKTQGIMQSVKERRRKSERNLTKVSALDVVVAAGVVNVDLAASVDVLTVVKFVIYSSEK